MNSRALARAILVGGAVGGALDLAFAFTFAAANGAAPERVLRIIASGALGEPAFHDVTWAPALGLACHFLLSWLWAGLFAALAVRVRGCVAHPLVAGAIFGFGVFFAMRLVVLPLSAFPRPVRFPPLATALDLGSHMLLFGMPIAWWIARALRPRASG
ncbi:MAG: hypothetical protein JSR18_07065 [Proteobacteria bacterium]|nr:hypothetical protein [Pseudomonadota bacterium]